MGRLPPPPPPLPPLPPAKSPPLRSFFTMVAVAHLRLGATSSATISTFDRFSPSWVSQERWSRRPDTMTRVPFWTVSLTFSASCCQHVTSKNDVASSHSLVCRFCQRRLTARPNVATACPDGVNRSSGSRVQLPTTVTLLSFAILDSPWFA